MTAYMGYEGSISYGIKGNTANTVLLNTRDITYGLDTTKGETTVRGDGTAPPIMTERVTIRQITINWQMTHKSTDTALTALLTAAYAGTAVALRLLDKLAGKGYDGDVTLAVSAGRPLKGEQTLDFTATPTDEDRVPQLYV